jgi:hypothetical protein
LYRRRQQELQVTASACLQATAADSHLLSAALFVHVLVSREQLQETSLDAQIPTALTVLQP